MGFKHCNFTHFYEILDLQKTSYVSNISAPLAARPVFFLPFYHVFLKKWWNEFIESVFRLKSNFQHKNNYLDLHHVQGMWNLLHKFHLYLIQILSVIGYLYLYKLISLSDVDFQVAMAGLLGLAIFVLIKAEDVLGFHIVTDLSNDNPTAVHFSILLVSN